MTSQAATCGTSAEQTETLETRVAELIALRKSGAFRDLPKYVYAKQRGKYLYFMRPGVCVRMQHPFGSQAFEEQYQELFAPYERKPPKSKPKVKRAALPPQGELLRIFQYEPETGALYRIRNGKRADKPTGDKRYRKVCIGRRAWLAHRVIWKMMHGVDPHTIDHINGDGHDNRMGNIRSVAEKINMRNRSGLSAGRTGVLGVTHYLGQWRVLAGGMYLGLFRSFDEAVAIRKEAERQLGYTERHGSNA